MQGDIIEPVKCDVSEEQLRELALDLEQLHAGLVRAVDNSPLRLHIETCATCQQRLNLMFDDRQLHDVQEIALRNLQRSFHQSAPQRLDPGLVENLVSLFENARSDNQITHGQIQHGIEQSSQPTRIGNYEVIDEIGRGGTGVVYRARDLRLGREVAIKVLIPQAITTQMRARFVREGRVMAAMEDRGILPIFEVIDDAQSPSIVMPIMEGGSLNTRIERNDYALLQAVHWVMEVAEALIAVHRAGCIHRDIKPGNVLLDAHGQVRLADFGLVRWQADIAVTDANAIPGTPEYLCPESLGAPKQTVSQRSDIYQCGLLLYHLLCGRTPYQGSVANILQQIVHSDPVSPRRIRPDIPRDIERICLKAIRKLPQERYGSAIELASDLQNFLCGRPVQARPIPVWHRLGRELRRRPRTTLLGLAGIGATFVLGGFTWQATQRVAELAADNTQLTHLTANLDAQSQQLKQSVEQAEGEKRAAEIEKEFTQGQILQALVAGVKPRDPAPTPNQLKDLFLTKLNESLTTALAVAQARRDPPQSIATHALGVAQINRQVFDYRKVLEVSLIAVENLTDLVQAHNDTSHLTNLVIARRVMLEARVELSDFATAQPEITEQRRLIEQLVELLPLSNVPAMERLWLETLALRTQRGLNRAPVSDSQIDLVMELWRKAADSLAAPNQAAPTYTEASRLLVQLLRDVGRLQDVEEVEAKLTSSH